MELRIENGRGKWRKVESDEPLLYKALDDAMRAAIYANSKIDPDLANELFYPVALYGQDRVYLTKIKGGYSFAQDRIVDPSYAAWVPTVALRAGHEKRKREVSPETREKLAKNLEKARAARGKK